MEQYEKRGYLRDDYRIFHLTDRARRSFAFHYHDFYKVLVLLQGRVNYCVEGRSFSLEPNDVVLISEGELHHPEVLDDSPYERIILYLSPEFLRRYQEEADLLRCFREAREHGSNVWFDGWCIPKYAKNTEAANMFINFLCRPDISIKNMEFIGYTSAIATPEILEWIEENYSADEYEPVDLSYFFGEEYSAVPVDIVQYPSAAIIANSAVMRDYGNNQEIMLDLWTSIKNS